MPEIYLKLLLASLSFEFIRPAGGLVRETPNLVVS